MNIYRELEKFSADDNKIPLVKSYLLDCCRKYIKYRSSGELGKALVVGQKYLKSQASCKEVHDAEWMLEAEAFGVSYYMDEDCCLALRVDKNIAADLVKIRIRFLLTHRESVKFLENLAYFINGVFSYLEYTPNGIPRERYDMFLCPKLFNIHFGRFVYNA